MLYAPHDAWQCFSKDASRKGQNGVSFQKKKKKKNVLVYKGEDFVMMAMMAIESKVETCRSFNETLMTCLTISFRTYDMPNIYALN